MAEKRKRDSDQDEVNKKQDRKIRPKGTIPVVEIPSKRVSFTKTPSPSIPPIPPTPILAPVPNPPTPPKPTSVAPKAKTPKPKETPKASPMPKTYPHPRETPKTDDEEDSPERAPKPIRLIEKKYRTRPFDITKFLNETDVQGLSIADLLYWSPAIRQKLAKGLRSAEPSKRINLLRNNPMLGPLLSQEDDDATVQQIGRINKVSISRTSTHHTWALVNGVTNKLYLDNGCCLICIHSRVRQRNGWSLTKNTSSLQLKLADGNSPNIEGEVHNLVFKLTDHFEIPLNVVSIHNLDSDFLMGRPFFEILRTITDHGRDLYHIRWNGRWAVIDVGGGICQYQRKLKGTEVKDWDLSRPPILTKLRTTATNGSTSDDNSGGTTDRPITRSMAKKLELSPDGTELILSDDPDYDLDKDIDSGEVSVNNLYLLRTCPDVYQDSPQLLTDDTPEYHDFRAYLTRVSSSSSNETITEVPPAPITPIRDLRIFSWNVNSIRNLLKVDSAFTQTYGALSPLEAFLEKEKIDVLCLQEHRLSTPADFRDSFVKMKGYLCYYTFAQNLKGYSGVSVFARTGLVMRVTEGFGIFEFDQEGRVLTAYLTNGIAIINAYLPNGFTSDEVLETRLEYKKKFLLAFEAHIRTVEGTSPHTIVIGDLNAVYRTIDTWRTREWNTISPYLPFEREFISNLLLRDYVDTAVHMNTATFTYVDVPPKRRRTMETAVGIRIDYCFTTASLRSALTRSRTRYDILGSDHFAIEVAFSFNEQEPQSLARILSIGQSIDPSGPTSITIGGATISTTTPTRTTTVTKKLDSTLFGGRQINIGNMPIMDEPDINQKIHDLFNEYQEELLAPGTIARTMTGLPPMDITLDPTNHSPLPRAKVQRWTPMQEKVLNEYDDKMSAAGKLEPSISQTSAYPILVPKPDGTWRIVFNFLINKRLIPYLWPLEPADKVLQKAAQWALLSCFDFALGYHQLPLRTVVRWLTAVVFPRGLRQYTVAPMGWKDSAEWLGYHLSLVFDHPDLKEHLCLFRDDGTLGNNGATPRAQVLQHIELLRLVFARVKKHNATLSDKKSYFFVQRYSSLGFIIGQGEIIPERDKIHSIMNWAPPTDQKKLRSFIGFVNFISTHIPLLAESTAPLTDLEGKLYKPVRMFQREWASNDKYLTAFNKVKEQCSRITSLRVFDTARPIIIAGDACDYSIGTVAGHAEHTTDDDNITVTTRYLPCGFYSRKFTSSEKKYSLPEKEFLALVYGVMKVTPYIGRKLILLTDHKAWYQVQNKPSANKRVDRWRMVVASLPLEAGYPKILFRPGIKQSDVDPLSRQDTIESDYDGISDIDQHILEMVADPMVLSVNLLTLGWQPYDSIIRWLLGKELDTLTPERRKTIPRTALKFFVDQDGTLFRKGNLGIPPRRVPKGNEVHSLIAQYHGDNIGHLSAPDSYSLLSKNYYWYGMFSDVSKFIDACIACQQKKKRHDTGKYRLYRILPPPSMFVLLGMDTCLLPKAVGGYIGYHAIIDYTSGYLYAKPVTAFNGSKVIKTTQSWCHRFGYPQWINCDNAEYFIAGLFALWAKKHHIQLNGGASQHPMGNGKIENINRWFPLLIAKRLLHAKLPISRWPDVFDAALSDWNIHKDRVKGISAFQFVFGQDMRFPTDSVLPYDEDELEELRTSTNPIVARIRAAVISSVEEQHRQYELDMKNRPPPITYQPGDYVWVYQKSFDSTFATTRKLLPSWILAQVVHCYPGGTYKLVDENGALYGQHTISHWRLRPAKTPPTWDEYTKPRSWYDNTIHNDNDYDTPASSDNNDRDNNTNNNNTNHHFGITTQNNTINNRGK